ncbi:MAG: MFS transporter [Denitrobacterium sp.]|jgi:sugar phosphate permease|nr:MFS transporter [Denitrobacterium sp.]
MALYFKGGEKSAKDLSKAHRIFLLILISMGSSTIYAPAYLKGVFYDPLQQALGCTNTDLGLMMSAYAITATICYLPSGIIADKVRMRTLAWVGFVSTSVLVFIYATLPSLATCYALFVGMGITTILIWWGTRFKVIRLIDSDEKYSQNIGISYGIYGAAGLVVGMINLAIVTAFADNAGAGITALLMWLGALILVLGILSFLFIPKFEGELVHDEKFSLGKFFKPFGHALKNPVVWIAALSYFFVYFYYTGVTYTTPYLSGVLGASLAVTSIVSVVRTYGITLLSGPVFGWIAKKLNSSATGIVIGSVLAFAGFVILMLMPSNEGAAVAAAVVIIALGFIANGVFSIGSSTLTEGKVPMTIFGAATGILSVVGFLPDTFSSTWFGAIIDAGQAAGDVAGAYHQIFLILGVSALIAAAFALLLRFYVNKNADKLQALADKAASEADEAK